MSEIALPCKCKLCGKTIGNFAVEWPPPKDNAAQESLNDQQFKRLCEAISKHLQQMAQALGPHDSHLQALAASISIGGNASMLMVARHFDLPEGAKGFFERTRQMVHEMSRVFRMTDADLEMLAEATAEKIECSGADADYNEKANAEWRAENKQTITDLLRSLRDQYEAGREQMKPEEPKALIV